MLCLFIVVLVGRMDDNDSAAVRHPTRTQRKGSHTIKEGTIVVMMDDQLPPLQWHLGRIEKVHPGKDDIIRTVTVRTSRGVYSRNVKQLAPLPVHNEARQLVT